MKISALILAAITAVPAVAQIQGPALVREYEPGIDARNYVFHVVIPDTGNTVGITGVMYFRRTKPTDSLWLDLEAPMKVKAVNLNGRAVQFARDEHTVRVALPAWNTICANSKPSSGDAVDPCIGWISVEASGIPADGLISTKDADGRWQFFGDNWPNRARNWLPTIDHPSDKAAVEWRVQAPSSLEVVANGTQIEKSPLPREANRTITVWHTDKPIPPYLMVIGAAHMARIDLAPYAAPACGRNEAGACVVQDVYEAANLAPRTPPGFTAAERIVSWLSSFVAPFPYERLSHVQSSTRYGGMENASTIFYADGQFKAMTLNENLVAHETAHQWFGDAVTPLRWADVWLSEGFATYFAALWQREAHGDSAFRSAMAGIKQRVVAAQEASTRPVVDSTQTDLLQLLNRNSYEKGGYFLHMLRKQVGDSAWIRGLRSYYAAHRHGNATTDDLERAIEGESKSDLKWFFDQWLRRPGFAELTTSWSFDESLILRVSQSTRFAPYRLTLTVEVEEADGTINRSHVDVSALQESQFSIEGKRTQTPRRVTVDPDGDLLAIITTR